MARINKNTGLEYRNGKYFYDGNLEVDGDLIVDVNLEIAGDLIVDGDVEAKDLIVTGKIEVGGDFVAADVACDHLEIGGNAEIDNLICQNSTVFIGGDFTVAGEARTATGKLEVESL